MNRDDAERGPGREKGEEARAEEERSVSPPVVHAAIRLEGEEELERTTSALFWSGLAAGLSMGFSLVARGLLHTHLPDESWRPIVSALGFSVGFVFVVLGRQQLFTENTLTPILPLLERWSLLGAVARLWAVVLVANLVGAALFAWVTATTELFPLDVRAEFARLGSDELVPPFGLTLLRAVFAGMLIALMTWMLPGSGPARLAVIVIPTWLTALAHFGHIVTGSVAVLHLVFSGGASVGDYLTGFFLPVLVGNVIGGVLLVALVNHAQVKAGGGTR